jgi:hypothetical protein
MLAHLAQVAQLAQLAGADGVVEGVHGLNGYSLALLLHILLFVYWLGGDLGVFYSSRYILKSDLSPQTRAVAAKIMHGIDLAPRICLVLFLPSGVTLMKTGPLGDQFFAPWWLLGLMWVGFGIWLAVAIADFRGGDTPAGRRYQVADIWVRYVLVAVLLVVSAYTIIVAEPFGVDTNPKWLGAKVLAYGLCILMGVLIRRELKPFGPAFGQLMTTGSTPEVERAIVGSIKRCEPYVFAIWGLVLAAAVLGVIKPGSTAF